ncbi:MAG TPA: GNAT family N-acetyltransferase [Thermoanaerobaculia bacterium]|nr:GNAT family N-acetyltransferase [Thermoanaerobaculia bacterium]
MFSIIPDGRAFSEFAILRDGETVRLRAALPEDVPAVDAFLRGVSRESLSMRFMGAVAEVPRPVIEAMCAGDPRENFSLLAVAGPAEGPRIAGLGSYAATGAGGRAEVAFLVHDDFQGRGISTLLLERLAGIAAANGFLGFEAEVLSENLAMINVFRDSGFEVVQAFDGAGVVHVEFPVAARESLRERVELRERVAAANSILPFFRPRSVAVIGASRDPAAIGSLIFRAILRGNFAGAVYPVNRQAASVHGVRAHPSVRDLPEPPDLAIIAVPAEGAVDAAREALATGCRALLVLTSGFAESGPDGAARQAELLEAVRSHGARLIGPNCLGLMNTDPEVRLNASLAPAMAPRGRIGFFSHSAALGIVILEYAAERGLGFSTFVSAGNRADVSGNDLLQFWEEDSSTGLALLYLETFGSARRFARIARRLAHRKPVLCVKSARSRAGRDVARAHIAAGTSGAAGQSDTNVDALFRQAGVIRADTIEEMFDVAALLANQPLPGGNRVGIVGNSGGVLTICADACDAEGLSVVGHAVVDLGAMAEVARYERAVEDAIAREDVDALIAIYACVGECDPRIVGRAIRRAALRAERRSGVAKPVLLCLMGAAGAVAFAGEGEAEGSPRPVFPSYRFPESAARALGKAVPYAAFRRRPAGRVSEFDGVDSAAARAAVAAALDAAGADSVTVDGLPAAEILRAFGLAADPGAPLPGAEATLSVSSDPSFGPLLRIEPRDRTAVVRITPLTDEDVREAAETSGLGRFAGAADLLGRASQMIEELPWISGMRAEIRRSGGEPGTLGLAGVAIDLQRSGSTPSASAPPVPAAEPAGR